MLKNLLIFTVPLWFAACGAKVPDSIKIGVAQPLSGPSAARGQDLVNGAKMAAAELNSRGYKIGGNTVKIEIVAVDDKADKEEAKKVAQQLVDQKVVAVIGDLSSDITEVTIPIYKAGNVPQLFTSSAVDLLKSADGNGFRLIANDNLQARAMAGYVSGTLNAGKVAIIHEDTAFGNPLAAEIVTTLTKANRKVEFNESVSNKKTDFPDFVAKLKTAPPDALVAVLRDNQLLPLFAQMNAAGLGNIPVMVPGSAKTQKLGAGKDVSNVFASSSSLDPVEFSGGVDFLGRFRAAYSSEPVWAAHYAYDAVYVLADVMRRANSVDPAILRGKLATIDAIAPVTSTMRFNPDGEQRYAAIAIYQKRDGKWTPLTRSDRW